jgi:hypothetical protein
MKVITNPKWQESAELRCYHEALHDNFCLLMEVLTVMRREASQVQDEPTTAFLSGVGKTVTAFAQLSAAFPPRFRAPGRRF